MNSKSMKAFYRVGDTKIGKRCIHSNQMALIRKFGIRALKIKEFWSGSPCVPYLCGAFDLFHHWQVYLSHLLAFWRLPWQRLTFACIFRRNGLRSSSRKIHSFRKIHSTVRPIFPLAHGRSTLKRIESRTLYFRLPTHKLKSCNLLKEVAQNYMILPT